MSKIKKPFELRLQDEKWSVVAEYEEYYEVSTYGVVKSFGRTIVTEKQTYYKPGRTLKQFIGKDGYCYVDLKVKNVRKRFPVHQLVWDTFRAEKRDNIHALVDHKNENKTDNRLCNLQLLNKRDNNIKSQSHGHLPGCSFYAGKWSARITIDGKDVYLGRHATQEAAHEAYTKARQSLVTV